MRQLFTSLLLVTCMLPVLAGVMQTTSDISAQNAPHVFQMSPDPLWPTQVVRVRPGINTYARIPGVEYPVVATIAQETTEPRSTDAVDLDNSLSSLSASIQSEAAHRQSEQWCASRYRSYDRETNTYQPYGEVSRRACISPTQVSLGQENVTQVSGIRPPSAHAMRCAARYSSYRVEDNSYQPYNGSRRQCVGAESENVMIATAENAGASTKH